MQLFLCYKTWQRENTLTCLFHLVSAILVILLRLVPSLNKLTVDKNDELLYQKASSSMNCFKNETIWKPRLVLRHPTWAYTLLWLARCCRGFRLFTPLGSFSKWRRGRRRRGRRLVKNEFVFSVFLYLRMSQLCKSVQYGCRSKNLLRLNMHRQRLIPKEDTIN